MESLLFGYGAPPPPNGPLDGGAAEVEHQQVLLLSALALFERDETRGEGGSQDKAYISSTRTSGQGAQTLPPLALQRMSVSCQL